MPRKTPSDRRDAILSAAREEFAARGFAGARLEDVAARVGVSKAALYLQFADKQALFLAMIDGLLDANFPETLPDALMALPIADRLRAMITLAIARVALGDIAFLPRLIIGESGNFPEIARAWHDKAVVRVLGLFEAVIADGIARGDLRPVDPAMATRSIAGGIVLSALWRTVLEPVGAAHIDLDRFAESHVDVLLNGLLAGDTR